MIHRLRRRHFRIWVGLAILVPALLVAGLLSREPVPASAVPATVSARPGVGGVAIWEANRKIAGSDVAMTLRRLSDGSLFLDIHPTEPLKRPAVLAYWARFGANSVDDHARLLGGVAPSGVSTFPVHAGDPPGTVVLYSLAHSRVLAAVSVAVVEDE